MSLFKFTMAAAAMSVGLGLAASKAQDLPDLGGQSVVVVTENAYPPLQFIDPATGDQIGWEYDAMNEIAERLNFEVTYQNTSWDAMIQAVSDGQYEIGMTGISIKEDRKEKVDFSDPYMRSEMFMLVRADETRFDDATSFAAFEDGLIGAQPGTTPFYVAVYDVLDGDEQNSRIKLMETFGATVQALRTGDVDMVLTDGVAGKGYVEASDGALKLVGGPLGTDDFGFIFPKGSSWCHPVKRRDRRNEGRRQRLTPINSPKWFPSITTPAALNRAGRAVLVAPIDRQAGFHLVALLARGAIALFLRHPDVLKRSLQPDLLDACLQRRRHH